MPATMDSVQRLMAGLAKRPVRSLLAGAYASIFTGRSLDFEDLREYVAGDDVGAIDWKATARSSKVLIQRSKAERRHHLILVVDTGLAMTASAPDGADKSDLAGLLAGVFVYLALGHGDLVSAHWGDKSGCRSLPPRGRAAHGDVLLASFNQSWYNEPADSDLPGLLEHTATTTRRRGAAIVISDDLAIGQPATAQKLRQLHARHEVMVLRVADLAPTLPLAMDAVDVTSGAVFSAAMHGGAAALQQAAALNQHRDQAVNSELSGQGIATVLVDGRDQVLGKVVEALERHRHVAN